MKTQNLHFNNIHLRSVVLACVVQMNVSGLGLPNCLLSHTKQQQNMSNFFNYDDPGAAQLYDETRVAMRADVIGGMLQVYCGKPLTVPLPLFELNQQTHWYFSYFSQKTGIDISCKLSQLA